MSVGLGIAMTAARSSLLTTQQQLAVISNNLANASDTSYHRQSATVTSNVTVQGDAAYYGTGCKISEVVRHYDSALENSLRTAVSDDGYWQTYSSQLESINDVVATSGDNPLSEDMNDFISSLESLINSPEDESVRTELLSSAETLCDTINANYSSLNSLKDYIASNDSTGTGELADSVAEVNSALQEIAELNDAIAEFESNVYLDEKANTLRDQRDALCQTVSEYLNINVTENSDGRYNITVNLSGGATATLVDGSTSPQQDANTLVMTMNENPAGSGLYEPSLSLSNDTATPITLQAESGKIQGLLDAREYIDDQMANLYTYANQLSTAYNTLQNSATAYDLNGNNNAGDLFSSPTSRPASGSIISVVMTDPDSIAASTVAGQDGNGSNASAILNMMNTKTSINGQNSSYVDYSVNYISEIAQDTSDSLASAKTSDSIKTMYADSVTSYSGVNTDEELTNMLSIQRSYQAAAKLISTIDSLLETMLGMV